MKNFNNLLKYNKITRSRGDPKLRHIKDVHLYFKSLFKVFGEVALTPGMNVLTKRIVKFYSAQGQRKNLRQVFLYLKEVSTLLYSWLSQGNYEPKVRISLDKSGLPRLLPISVRDNIKDRKVFILVQSILGLHRLIKWWPKVDYSTITSPFNGISPTLDPQLLLMAKVNLLKLCMPKLSDKTLQKWKLRLEPIKGLQIESSGPNGKVSWLQVVDDACAFHNEFSYTLSLVRLMIHSRAYLICFSFVLLFLLTWPLHLRRKLSKYELDPLLLGRTTVVRNVSGKSRVIAMTNYWIQICLYPLHKAVFKLLEIVPTDGTFDQLKPVRAMLDKGYKGKFYSFDLSAATDRLPVALQEQILTQFVSKEYAFMWRKLVSIPFEEGLRYEVGQPMGCYSSWAMLALTHHLIVNACVEKPNALYSVLGDDVVMTEDFQEKYLFLMNVLGVTVSLSKSMISDRYIEFAKKVIDTEGAYWSCLGPGLVLAFARDKLLAPLVLADLVNLNIHYIGSAIKVLEKISLGSKTTKRDFSFMLFALFGPRGLISRNYHVAVNTGMRWLSEDQLYTSSSVQHCFGLGLQSMAVMKYRKNKDLAKRNLIDNMEIWRKLFDPYETVMSWYGARLLDPSSHISGCWLRAWANFYKALVWLSPTPWLWLRHRIDDYWNLRLPSFDANQIEEAFHYLRVLHIEKIGALSRNERTEMRAAFRDLNKWFKINLERHGQALEGSDGVNPESEYSRFLKLLNLD